MNTPVLILAHERPELLERSLAQLQSAGCTNLYASVDGPSKKKKSEHAKVVSFLSGLIAQPKLNLIPTNLGCEKGVLNGIDWFFDQEEKGIIVEEDVLISETGLTYLSDMLSKYKNDSSVFMAGAHLPTGNWNSGQPHFFSRIGHIWGWATWKNRWQKHDRNSIEELVNSSLIQDSFGHTRLAEHLKTNLESCIAGEVDTWDFQWNLSMLANDRLCVLPNSNQVENIGVSDDALHTTALHTGVCNSFQEPIPASNEAIRVATDRVYEHEWLRRLKGELVQLKTCSDQLDLADQPLFKGSACLVSLTEIGGGAEKICHSIFNSSRPSNQRFLVSVKKTDNPKVLELGKPNRIARWLQSESELKRQTESADLIHLHNIHGMGLNWDDLIELADSKSIIWTLHDQWILGKNIDPPFAEEDSIPGKKLEFIHHQNVHLVTPSLWLQDKVYWKTRKLPTLIRYGIDTEVYRPTDRFLACLELGLDPTRKRILFIAKNPQSNPYKDFSGLQGAWKEANLKLGNAGFDLIGLGGPAVKEHHGQFEMSIIPFNENESDVCNWINACDIMAHATLSDNSPVSILEAMACKIPVIASSIGGINEQLDSGKCGILTPPKSSTSLLEAIIALTNLASKSERIDSAYNRVLKQHTKKQMIDSYLGLYAKVCS